MCTFCDKALLFVPKLLTRDFDFRLILPKKTLHRPKRLTESDRTFILHAYSSCQELSVCTKTFDFATLTLTFDLPLKKELALAITFEPKDIRQSSYKI